MMARIWAYNQDMSTLAPIQLTLIIVILMPIPTKKSVFKSFNIDILKHLLPIYLRMRKHKWTVDTNLLITKKSHSVLSFIHVFFQHDYLFISILAKIVICNIVITTIKKATLVIRITRLTTAFSYWRSAWLWNTVASPWYVMQCSQVETLT